LKTFLFQTHGIATSKRKKCIIIMPVFVFLTKMLRALDRRSTSIGNYWKMLLMIPQMISNAAGRPGNKNVFFVSLPGT
jgi:hypothetical protein